MFGKSLLEAFVVFLTFGSVLCNGDFHESVTMDVMNHNQLYSYFNFTTTFEYHERFTPQHYDLFPRSFGELLQKYQVAELHFTMTQGLWRYNQWGFPHSPSPTGAQLWVWFSRDSKDVDKNWVGFTNALSGLFCASLNFINKAVTVTPSMSYRPMGALRGKIDNKFLRYGTLSRENLCTENLTPWMKLLPCASKAGPASLLNPSQLHHSRYLSIGIHFKTVCSDLECSRSFAHLQQDVSVVFDLRVGSEQKPNFSLMSVFLVKLKPGCKVASQSRLKLKIPDSASVTPAIHDKQLDHYVLNLKTLSGPLNFNVKWRINPVLSTTTPTGITNHCYLTGIGLDGGLSCSIANNMDHNVTILFFQVFPWFLYTQLHTLTLKTDEGRKVQPFHVSFSPAKIRESPHTLELSFSLPAKSHTNLAIQFTRGFLTWTEHPPDANHGFYISPSTITLLTSDINTGVPNNNEVQRIYSEAILVNIPVPDFSMPYNVICLVCTVIAIAFGSLHNLTTRRLQKVSPTKPNIVKKKLGKLLSVFQRKPETKKEKES